MSFQDLPPHRRQKLRERLAEILGVELSKIPDEPEEDFLMDLGVDSLNVVEIIMEIEEEYLGD